MALTVIGSGFGRTGTRSLKSALETLGFGPCHHMEEVFGNPAQVPYWQAVAAGRPVDWDQVFDGFSAQVDWPGAYAWRELAQAYPNAKIVHSHRPEDAWWKSFSATIGKFMAEYEQMPLPPHVSDMVGAAMVMINDKTLGDFTNREACLAAYRAHSEAVKAAIPAERLLMFDVAQGWEPLCEFLEVDVPQEPFPHRNTAKEFWEMFAPPPA